MMRWMFRLSYRTPHSRHADPTLMEVACTIGSFLAAGHTPRTESFHMQCMWWNSCENHGKLQSVIRSRHCKVHAVCCRIDVWSASMHLHALMHTHSDDGDCMSFLLNGIFIIVIVIVAAVVSRPVPYSLPSPSLGSAASTISSVISTHPIDVNAT